MKEYLHSVEDVMTEYNTLSDGLSDEEVERRQAKYGKNKLASEKKENIATRFLKQLLEPMTIVLIVAAIISAITSIYSGEFPADVIIILLVAIINAVLGVYQESKAEKAIEALQQMASPSCKVIRNSKNITVQTEDLIVGDIVILEAGDSVPADCRIIESASLQIEESALTGESVPVDKQSDIIDSSDADDIPLGDRKNMCYMGSNVVYGRGKAVVVATGMNTEMGKIADALTKAKDNTTPLQQRLAQLSKVLTIVVICICAFIFVMDLAQALLNGDVITFDTFVDTFMIAVSLAVAAIPEGLVAVVTIALSVGVTKMSKRNAIIRKLSAVETLGCTQVICSDKTGTLTQNKMTVVDNSGGDEKITAQAMALCSDAFIEDGEVKGEPTEAALVAWAEKIGMSKADIENEFPRVNEIPFDSNRKMMTTVHSHEGTYIQYTKGAPDIILARCTYAMVDDKKVELTEKIKNEIMSENKRMADEALRVLAVAMRTYSEMPDMNDDGKVESDLCYIGLAGMIDPIREEVLDAVKECRDAGIRPIMITGDHKDTAVAIAKQLGILQDESEAITGQELDKLSDDEFKNTIENYGVYARVQPEHKVRIVNAWQSRGMVTAMTGDGVNDAPSIKNADIGVGMGVTGTDVTKNVADMVLADDNFATIVSAVEEGRRIYDNIRKTIQYLLSANLSEVLSIFIASMLGLTLLEPAHLLWINLITDCFPAFSLSVEKAEGNLMSRAPRKSSDGIFADRLGIDIIWQGIMLSAITLTAFFLGMYVMGDSGASAELLHQNGMTMAFLTLSMAESFHAFNMRSQRQSIFRLQGQNMYLYGSMLLTLILATVVVYIPPLASAFGFASVSFSEYIVSVGLAIAVIPIVEIVKAILRRVSKR